MINYRFSNNSKKLINVIRLIDNIGYFLVPRKNIEFKPDQINSICFVQLGHIGDFVMLLPVLQAFKKIFKLKIKVAINPVNQQLAEKTGFIDEIYVINHPFFNRSFPVEYSDFFNQFRKIESDMIFELRGDFRIIPFLRFFSSFNCLTGYNSGGFGFLLDKELSYPFGKHISDTYKSVLKIFSDVEIIPEKIWDLNSVPFKKYSFQGDSFICINVGVGGPARDWESFKFSELINRLSLKNKTVVIGKIAEIKAAEIAAGLIDSGNIANLINKTDLLSSVGIVKESSYFIGLESGFTHIAALLGKKTTAIYSDATELEVWTPIELFENQISIIKKKVHCGNCGKLICSDNICMQQITAEEVINSVLSRLQSS